MSTHVSLDPAGSSSTPTHCQVCSSKTAIYKCPRCHLRTCSLPCSSTHKTRDICSGIRNKAAYVPLNQYGWGTMMDDYTYLEDMGRHVNTWGRDIAQRGLVGANDRLVTVNNGRMNDRKGKGKVPHKGGFSKRDILKKQLEARDIDMELLPLGMTRRQANQSTWDSKNRTAHLTVEFIFHPPPDPLAPSGSTVETRKQHRILTHRNDFEATLYSLTVQAIRDPRKSKKDDLSPEWLKDEFLEQDASPSSALYLIRISPLPAKQGHGIAQLKKVYSKLDASEKLSKVLRNRSFVEFPTIEIWTDEDHFHDTIVDDAGAIAKFAEEVRPVKRRKLNSKGGKQTMKNLLGSYGSDEDTSEEQNVLSILDTYGGSGSEDDGEQADERNNTNVSRLTDVEAEAVPLHEEGGGEPARVENASEDDGEDDETSSADEAKLNAVLAAMQRDRLDRRGYEEDDVDWGESDGENE